MKYLALTPLILLSACARPSTEVSGEFDMLPVTIIEKPGCIFRATDSDDDDSALFVTYADNEDDLAVARFKSETIKLVPREEPDLSSDTIDVTYEVIDYLKWQVRIEATVSDPNATPAVYTGQISLVGTSVVSSVTGSCPN